MHALMLAAGLGERLRPHTLHVAKPALPFLNVPMLGYALYALEQAGLSNLVINTHHLPETIHTAMAKAAGTSYRVSYSHEAPEILGSGGGLAQARQFLAGASEIVLFNADTVCLFATPSAVSEMLEAHRKARALATLYVMPFPSGEKRFGGVYAEASGRVRRFSKTPVSDPALIAHHFTGLMVVSAQLLSHLQTSPSNLLYDDLQPRIDAGAIVQVHSDANMKWFETGNVTDYLAASKACIGLLGERSPVADHLRGVLSRFTPGWNQWSQGGLFAADSWEARCNRGTAIGTQPSAAAMRIGLREPTLQSQGACGLIDRGVNFGANCRLSGTVVLGVGVDVSDGAHLEDVVLGPGVVVPPNSHLKDQLLVNSK